MSEEYEQARARGEIISDRDIERRMTEAFSPWRSRGDTPVVALDIDGTLGDYHSHFLWFATHWFGREFPDPREVNPGIRLSTFMGISHREYRECKLAYRQGGLKRFMPAYPGADWLTHNIRKAGAQLWICTSRPYLRLDNIDPDTREWLRRNKIEYDAVIWEGIEDDPTKYYDLVDQVGLNRIVAVVDDLPEQISDAHRQGIRTVYMMDQPYNREPATPDAVRVTDMAELWGYLDMDIDIWKG
jgi:phosphoglycolate phosphatase-like HAD superfamily hydrolase